MAVLKLACDDNTVLLVSGRTVIGSCRRTFERLRARAEPSGRFFRRPLDHEHTRALARDLPL